MNACPICNLPEDNEEHPVCLLIREACNKINTGQRKSAIWRLIDAAGLLSVEFEKEMFDNSGWVEGVSGATDRWYLLTKMEE